MSISCSLAGIENSKRFFHVESRLESRSSSDSSATTLAIYSLRSHRVVERLSFDGVPKKLECSEKFIVIVRFSLFPLSLIAFLTDALFPLGNFFPSGTPRHLHLVPPTRVYDPSIRSRDFYDSAYHDLSVLRASGPFISIICIFISVFCKFDTSSCRLVRSSRQSRSPSRKYQ